MASNKQSKVNSKQYTLREIIMVTVLAGVALIYLYTNYFLFPTMNEIDQLKGETELLQIEYSERKALIAQKENLQDDFALYNREITSIKSEYFKTSNQEHFIKVLELDLIDDKDLDVLSLSFDTPRPSIEFISEENESPLIESSFTTFPFYGPYESVMNLLYRLERYTNLIRVNFLDITYQDMTKSAQNIVEPLYQGNIGLEFFTIPQEYESPWNTQLPDYDNAMAFYSGLFRYDDGKIGIPPFFVEKVPEVIVSEGQINTPIVENTPSGGTPTGSIQEDDSDEENDPAVNSDEQNTITYLVKPGDTIFSISMKFYGSNTQVEEIMTLNEITDPNTLESGTAIQLPLLMK